MSTHFVPPELNKKAFSCPHCGAFAAQEWQQLQLLNSRYFEPLVVAFCHHCTRFSAWVNDRKYGIQQMVFPDSTTAPLPNPDLPQDCMQDYMEASSVVGKSPRAAAALLRLCVQRLAKHLGCEGKNINDDIGELVQKGLPVRIQQALDVVRVVGNNAVHPGTMNLDDSPETALALFGLVNMIVDNQITQPKHVEALFDTLPERAKVAIEKRDTQ